MKSKTLKLSYVTKLGSYCFCNCYGFTSFDISNVDIKEIPTSAFENCTGFANDLTIPNKIVTINSKAFSGCGFEGNLTLSTNIKNIDDYAFYGLRKIKGISKFGPNIARIGNNAFAYCSSLNCELNFEDCKGDTLSIRDQAFYCCSSLFGTLKFPENVTYIGAGAFAYCSGFTQLSLNYGKLTMIGNRAFFHCSGFKNSLYIPSYVTEIGDEAFSGCSGFKNALTVPRIRYGKGVFSFCTGFNELRFYDSYGDAYEYMFLGCTGINKIYYPINYLSVYSHAFEGCTGLSSIMYLRNINIVGDYGFAGCSNLTVLDMRNIQSTDIRSYTFANCTGLQGNLVIPDSIFRLQEGCFYNCYSLEGLELNTVITSIPDFAFYNCSGMKGILSIPIIVDTIGKSAFELTNFSEIVYVKTNPLICGENAFPNYTKISVSKHYISNDFCGVSLNKENDPIVIPTPTPIPEVSETIEYDPETENAATLKTKIEKAFQNLNKESQYSKSNKVVYINAEQYNFTSTLSSDEFISSNGNTIIDFKEGNLNLAVDKKDNITVKLNNEDSDLMIKGNGNLNIKTPYNSQSFHITNIFDVNGTLNINLNPGNFNTNISIDSIRLSNNAILSISKIYNSNTYAGTIDVPPNSKVALQSIDIKDKLILSQSSLLNIGDVSLESTTINMNMDNYDDLKNILSDFF